LLRLIGNKASKTNPMTKILVSMKSYDLINSKRVSKTIKKEGKRA